MVQKINLFLLLFIGLFLLNFVSAQPPFQFSTGPNSLEIAGVDFSAIKGSMQRTAVASVYNFSTGLPVSNAFCEFRVYKVFDSGSLVYTNQSPTKLNNTYFFGIPNTVYNTSGEYTRLIQCNTSTQGGFYKSSFQVNSIGEEVTTATSIFYSVSFLALIFLFIVNVGAIPFVPSRDKKDSEGNIMELEPLKYIQMLLYITAYVFLTAIMFVGSNIASAFLQSTLLANMLFMGFRFLMWGAIIGVPLWIILIILNIFNDKETKNMMERGVGQDEWETP